MAQPEKVGWDAETVTRQIQDFNLLTDEIRKHRDRAALVRAELRKIPISELRGWNVDEAVIEWLAEEG